MSNLAMQAMTRSGPLRAKLELGGLDDPEERQAERFAAVATGAPQALAWDWQAERDANQAVRRQPAGPPSGGPPPVGGSAIDDFSGGQPLSQDVRSLFEPSLGRDLSDVRVHTGSDAAASAASIGARAYTLGSNIAFAHGQYQPESREGRRLIAHELAHVRQAEAAPITSAIRREVAQPASADANAAKDLELKTMHTHWPAYFRLQAARDLGGLTRWKQAYPLSYADMRLSVINAIGEVPFEKLEKNDAAILPLVEKSREVIDKLNKLYDAYEDKPDGRVVVNFYTGHIGTRGFYEFDYVFFGLLFKDNPRAIVQDFAILLTGTVDEIVTSVRESADLAQSEADERQAERDAWKEVGETALGKQIAIKQNTLWSDDKITLAELMTPEYGSEDADEMLTVARLTGATTAIAKVEGRYFIYLLNEQYDREDIFLLPDKDVYVELIPKGPMAAAVYKVTANGGFVLSPPSGGEELYRAGDEGRNALQRLESVTSMQESGKAAAYGFTPLQVFQRMLMDLALLNLQQSEARLIEAERQVQDEGMFAPIPSEKKGDRLKADTDRLRQLTIDLNLLGAELEGKEATDEQMDRRDSLLMETATLVQKNPAAALFIRNTRDPESTDPFEASDIENKLGKRTGVDAASFAIKEARKRRENVAKVRRAIFDNPSSVLDFDILHESVLAYFSPDERTSIRFGLGFHTLDKFASGVQIALVDLSLLVLGIFTGGETWIGLAVHGGSLGLGGYQLYNQAQEAALISAQSAIDVEGGFQLASPDQAKSARNWLLVSAGLNLLGAWGFTRTVGNFLRASARDATLTARFAARLGVSEDVLSAALRKNWRGVPNPDPNALRQILLKGMDPKVAARYEKIEIEILSEADWLKRHPNSAAQAETHFASNAAGETVATKVSFRRGASLLSLEEEAAHIQQAADPKWGAKLLGTQDLARQWSTLTPLAKLRGVRETLEIEMDVQKQLLERSKLLGDMESADDAFAHIEDIKGRIADIDAKLANPSNNKLLEWFDPNAAPGIFASPRLPRAGTRGAWSGRAGNSVWTPTDPDAISIIGKGNGVRFRNHYPNFAPWSKGQVNLGTMSGHIDDFAEADRMFAEGIMKGSRDVPSGYTKLDFIHNGKPSAAGTAFYRKQAGLTWHHHQGGKIMMLIPTKLHSKVPHTGGAAAARAGS